jgi:hypothetical protein
MIMSVVKSLAPVTLGTVLIAISPASLSASDAQDLAFAHADMPIKQLKTSIWIASGEAAGALGTEDVMYCSMREFRLGAR